jgi:hypothetical protein
MSGETRAAVHELAQIMLFVLFLSGAAVFAIGLGLISLASMREVATPGWASLLRDGGAIGMGFCVVGEGVLQAASALSWLPSRKDEERTASTPKDAA